MNALVAQPVTNAELYRASSDAASLCKEIVVATAVTIQGRKYVRVEGWQAIAIAHGCTGSAREVETIEGGVRAIGEIRRMSDGAVIAEAEGFVGRDEPTWFGGRVGDKTLPKRADYAIRAMAQTRAISRAGRSAFAHVVVMMNAGLSTTPAEEVPAEGFDNEPRNVTPPRQRRNDVPRGEASTEGEYPADHGRRPAALVAAEAAILMCETRGQLTEWLEKNQAALDKMDAGPVYDAILSAYRYRWRALGADPSKTAVEREAEEVFS